MREIRQRKSWNLLEIMTSVTLEWLSMKRCQDIPLHVSFGQYNASHIVFDMIVGWYSLHRGIA